MNSESPNCIVINFINMINIFLGSFQVRLRAAQCC
jgi:hypothetical protein